MSRRFVRREEVRARAEDIVRRPPNLSLTRHVTFWVEPIGTVRQRSSSPNALSGHARDRIGVARKPDGDLGHAAILSDEDRSPVSNPLVSRRCRGG